MRGWLRDPAAQDAWVDALCWLVIAGVVWQLRWSMFWPVWLPLRLAFGG